MEAGGLKIQGLGNIDPSKIKIKSEDFIVLATHLTRKTTWRAAVRCRAKLEDDEPE